MAIRPGISKYDWEVELTDTKSRKKYGLKVPQGSLTIGTISEDDTVYVRNVGKRVGDFDEQRSWKGGRGIENLSDNAEGFWDSQNAWTLTPGHVHPTLQWYHARGLRSEDMFMPTRDLGDVRFVPLLGTRLYIANSFAASANYNADRAYLWLRRRGSPGTLTLRLMSDSGGSLNAALKTVTVTTSDVTDFVSVYQLFNWTSTEALTSGVTYWVSVHGDSADDRDNHWEVGVDPDTSSGKTSSDGSTWASAEFALYYRVTSSNVNRRWYNFVLKEALYVVDQRDNDSTASVMYINGDRGKATSGTASTLADTAKTWVENRWAGAWVKIIAGQGSRNLPMEILSNTTTTLTVDGEWDTNPGATSQYIIYATDWFTAVSLTGASLGVVTGRPAVANHVAYIPQGGTALIHMQWNSTTLAHDGFSETAASVNGLASLLHVATDSTDGPVMWRANNTGGTGSGGNGTVSRANLLSSGAFIPWNTTLSFKTAIFTGGANFLITNLAGKKQVYVAREDGIGTITNDKYEPLGEELEKTPDRANGMTLLMHGSMVYYSWLHSVVRIYGSSHDDIGDDYRSIGLPSKREGEYADGDTYLKTIYFAIDAGGGLSVSSVLAWDGLGWHEMIRGREPGARIRMVKVQTCPGTHNRLWTQMGSDLVCQELPYKKAAPRLDTDARYMHEAVIESASIDMGTASAMPKFIKELTATISRMNSNGRVVYVDIQMDDDVHTSTWNYAGVFTKSPESTLFLGLQNVRRFAYRLRICTDSNNVPVDVEGVVPNGFARIPFKMVFTMQISAGGIFSRRGKMATSGELMRWLLDAARQPGRIRMNSVYEMADSWYVIIHPPRQFPLVPKKGRNPETANFTLTLQEA